MLQDDVKRGVALVSGEAGLRPEQVEGVSTAIASDALFDISGRRALALDPAHGGLVFYDLFKAVTATAGVLGVAATVVTGPVTLPVVLPAVLSAVAALGSLQGLRQPLPRACAQVVALLLERQDRKMTRGELRSEFEGIYDGPADEQETDLERALQGLERVKSIRIEHGTVRLVERVVIRL